MLGGSDGAVGRGIGEGRANTGGPLCARRLVAMSASRSASMSVARDGPPASRAPGDAGLGAGTSGPAACGDAAAVGAGSGLAVSAVLPVRKVPPTASATPTATAATAIAIIRRWRLCLGALCSASELITLNRGCARAAAS